MQKQIQAMQAAGVGCGLMLAIIAYFIFTTPSNEFVDYMTQAGQLVGQGTTVGIFMLAALPPISAVIFYFGWKWITK